ncbi:hypothetical protein ACO1O0_000121 [Amphichorda felina]
MPFTSNSKQAQTATSDAASEVTMIDTASTYSKTGTLSSHLKSKATKQTNPIPKKDPYKSWEARASSYLYRS